MKLSEWRYVVKEQIVNYRRQKAKGTEKSAQDNLKAFWDLERGKDDDEDKRRCGAEWIQRREEKRGRILCNWIAFLH